jgi:pimeloyl-ACP methyl ester carboxylesterase
MDRRMTQDLGTGSPRCRVMAAGILTTYRVAGHGQTLLLLTADQTALARLFSRLSATNRVVAPDLSTQPGGENAAPWLAAFIEALGLTHVDIIADADYAPAARSLALTDPDRVETLVRIRDVQCAVD